MAKKWEVQDNTSAKGGYLQLTFAGKRVCDFFPFARDADEQWIREQAQVIADTMNRVAPGE